jgi:hypothetical protein
MEFYPAHIPVPEEKRTNRLFLRPLRVTDVALDYEAVMSSAEQLRRWSQSEWPADDFTLAQNHDDLQRHEREHYERQAFTFTVLNPSETHCLGCVYIMPLEPDIAHVCAGAVYAANVGFWVRTSEVATDLDKHLFAALREWFTAEWAFECVVFVISQQETRQAALLSEAGLERRSTVTLPDGRLCWVFA